MRYTLLALILAATLAAPALADAGAVPVVPLQMVQAAAPPVVKDLPAAELGPVPFDSSMPAPAPVQPIGNASVVHRIVGSSETSAFSSQPVFQVAPKPFMTPAQVLVSGGPNAVPEPGSILALMVGLTGMYGVYRKQRSR